MRSTPLAVTRTRSDFGTPPVLIVTSRVAAAPFAGNSPAAHTPSPSSHSTFDIPSADIAADRLTFAVSETNGRPGADGASTGEATPSVTRGTGRGAGGACHTTNSVVCVSYLANSPSAPAFRTVTRTAVLASGLSASADGSNAPSLPSVSATGRSPPGPVVVTVPTSFSPPAAWTVIVSLSAGLVTSAPGSTPLPSASTRAVGATGT